MNEQYKMPKVSVIIPTYNRARFVGEAIDSVLAQTYKDYEIIVVDDGSTDNTQEVLKHYGHKIRYFRQENKGISAARNLALEKARGEYIAFLDDDDLWLPEKLEKQIDVLERNPDLAFVASETHVINGKGEIIDRFKRGKGDVETFENLRQQYFVPMLTTVVRRKCLDSVGGFNPSLPICQDHDLWLRLAKIYKFRYIDVPLAKYRMHANNITKNLDQYLRDHLVIATASEFVSDMPFVERRIRKSKVYYRFAEQYYLTNSFAKAGINFLKAWLTYPLIGGQYWPKGLRNLRCSLPLRIMVPYWMTVDSFIKMLFPGNGARHIQ